MSNAKFTFKSGPLPCYQCTHFNCTKDAGQLVQHGFFTAKGGASFGLYESLNCGFGASDDPALIAENWRRVATSLGFKTDRMFGLRQTHSPHCVFVDSASDPGIRARPVADAMVTATANHALAILTADCVPVLFSARSAGLVGAAHAGWRGAVDGVLGTTIAMMVDKGSSPQHIKAVIGPAIQQPNYQVGDDLHSLVLSKHKDARGLFIPDEAGRYKFDLPGFVEMRLREAGLDHVYNLGIDTYGESSGFFSHRRATHTSLADTGRQISVIGLLSEKAS